MYQHIALKGHISTSSARCDIISRRLIPTLGRCDKYTPERPNRYTIMRCDSYIPERRDKSPSLPTTFHRSLAKVQCHKVKGLWVKG